MGGFWLPEGRDRHDAPRYIEAVPNRGSPPGILLGESYREAGKVKKRMLLNQDSRSPDQTGLSLAGRSRARPRVLSMLAYYLEWHMRQRLAPTLYGTRTGVPPEAGPPTSLAGWPRSAAIT